MLDVENLKTILQAEVKRRENAKAKLQQYRNSGNKRQEQIYKRKYEIYSSRFAGMCDLLFEIGYDAWCNDENKIFVEKIVEGENYLSVQIPI